MMEVEKRGKVEIIRLRRKRHKPERELSPRRLLRTLRVLFPCRAEEIDADQLIDIIIETFGDEEYHLLISDEKYRVISKEEMAELLRKDDTNFLPYIPTYADCDDFSDVLLGQLTRKTWSQGFAIGQLWFYTEEWGHAINFFVDGEKLWLVEPQNDRIFTWESVREKHPSAKAYMVKI